MSTALKLAASLVAAAALAGVSANTAQAAPATWGTFYTCVKESRFGPDVRLGVPGIVVPLLEFFGFTCSPVTEDDEDEGNEDEGNEDEEQGDEGPSTEPVAIAPIVVEVPQESRSLYCSTNGLAHRGNGDGPGLALNLTKVQGAEMVDAGLVKPAIFYQGVGASCDVLPGFEYSGLWVDNVGDVVPGVAIYPLFVSG
jgi:hypothetical protein